MELSSANDDFLYPHNQDTTQKCVTMKSITEAPEGLTFMAVLSIVCYLYLFWMYFGLNSPVFKRHPTTLAIYKCLFECIIVQQFLWIPYVKSGVFYKSDLDSEPYYCVASSSAAWWAFLSQVSLLGSELWFFIISVDMRLAYTNPFTSYKHNRVYFSAFVTITAVASAVLLLLFGPQVYGMSEIGLVWIQIRRSVGNHISPNYPKILFYYLPSTIIYVYCTWANFQVYKSANTELNQTISNRWTIMQRSKRYTAGFVLYGFVIYLIEFITIVVNHRSGTESGPAPCYFYAMRGVWSLVIILYSNLNELSWDELNPFRFSFNKPDLVANVAQERLLLSPHLNTALRAEILYFTTQGIMFAAKEFDARKSPRVAPQVPEEEVDRLYSFDHKGPRIVDITEASGDARRSSLSGLSSVIANALKRGDATTINAAIVMETEDGARDTIVEISRLQRQQDEATREDYENAMLEEFENMGASTAMHSIYSKPSLALPSGMSLTAAVAGGAAFLVEGSNPMHETNGQLRAPAESISNLPPTNPSLYQRSRNHHVIELTGPSDTIRTDGGGDRPVSVSSNDSTVKWSGEDATDVEFGIRNSSASVRDSSASHMSAPWRRIRNNANAMPSIASEDGSHSSKSDSVLRAIHNAINTATTAAKNVFIPAYNEFRFKDFCPKLFAAVRAMHNISAAEYAKSFETTCRERFSEGRSGAFMFYSSDQRCIVKTTTKEESLALQSIMPAFVKYLESNPTSLLVRFLGSHCITMYGVEIYFVVMLNVFPTFSLSERYDLKGSWVNRHGFKGSRRTRLERKKREKASAPLFQDNDLQNTIAIESDVAHTLAVQIRSDIRFLQDHNFMDYSLLIGVRRERFKVVPNVAPPPSPSLPTLRPSQDTRTARSMSTNSRKSLLPDQSADRGTEVMRSPSMLVTPVDTSQGRAGEAESASRWRIVSQDGEDLLKRDEFGGIRAELVEGPGTYYIGIIDILQKWNWKKRIERFFKIYFKFLDGEGLSAISPEPYCRRFWKRVVLDTFEGLSDLNTDVFDDEVYLPDDSIRQSSVPTWSVPGTT